ncbi:chorismate mutase [Candidatus Woesearchaeota archaeon]|nr:chorismate mutase [Candidatus Woesearchaeota archaeon]
MTGAQIEDIRGRLQAMEETIIFSLIERAQYRLNHGIYEVNGSGFYMHNTTSRLERALQQQELLIGSSNGMFDAPEVRPFSPNLPRAGRSHKLASDGLFLTDLNAVNLNSEILGAYLEFIRAVCMEGDDGQYWHDALERDVTALRSISRRVHYGALHIAEHKFLEGPEAYIELVSSGDIEGIKSRLRVRRIEDETVLRVTRKAHDIQSYSDHELRRRLGPEAVGRFYMEHIMPITLEGEVRYILQRPVSLERSLP